MTGKISLSDGSEYSLPSGATQRAFISLPPRLQKVMWLSDVERLHTYEIARRLPMSEREIEISIRRAHDLVMTFFFIDSLSSGGNFGIAS